MPFPCLDRAVQGGFGYLERPAYLRNRVPFLIEISGNTCLFASQRFWPAADSSPLSGSYQSCVCPLPDKISLKFRKRAKDMKD